MPPSNVTNVAAFEPREGRPTHMLKRPAFRPPKRGGGCMSTVDQPVFGAHNGIATRTVCAVLTSVAFVAGFSLMAAQAQAQQRTAEVAAGPFESLAGSWSGAGTITMKDGGHERIRCRGTYAVESGGSSLQQELRCASDSYKFEMSTNVSQVGGQLAGNWTENTRHIAGRVSGHATPTQIQARAD